MAERAGMRTLWSGPELTWGQVQKAGLLARPCLARSRPSPLLPCPRLSLTPGASGFSPSLRLPSVTPSSRLALEVCT